MGKQDMPLLQHRSLSTDLETIVKGVVVGAYAGTRRRPRRCSQRARRAGWR
jgi:hypothetical protein